MNYDIFSKTAPAMPKPGRGWIYPKKSSKMGVKRHVKHLLDGDFFRGCPFSRCEPRKSRQQKSRDLRRMMCPTRLPGHGKGTQASSHGGGIRPFRRHGDGTGQSSSGQARETVLALFGAGRGNISRPDGRLGFNGSLGVFSTGSRLSHRKAQFNFPTGKNIFPSWIFIFSQLGKFCEAFLDQDKRLS